MAKKFFKRWLPDPAEFKKRSSLNFLGHLLHDPNLFHLNRHSVSGAFFIGLFVAFLPMPGQMPIAASLALLGRVNLPIAVALVWISNPVTMPPIFFACYELGRWVLNSPPVEFSMRLSKEWFSTEFTLLWKPLLAGCLLSGVFFGGLGYISIQLYWRFHVLRNWEKRKQNRLQQAEKNTKNL